MASSEKAIIIEESASEEVLSVLALLLEVNWAKRVAIIPEVNYDRHVKDSLYRGQDQQRS
jgi:hypothetical protein